MKDRYYVYPLGVIRIEKDSVRIEIEPTYRDAFLGLDGFSHIVVLYWFHENDTALKRNTLRVHPRKDKKNPLTGVFATHSPRRPNPIGLTLCKINSIEGRHIKIEDIDAFDETPVIDIKCYIPGSVAESDIYLPGWV